MNMWVNVVGIHIIKRILPIHICKRIVDGFFKKKKEKKNKDRKREKDLLQK